ncbi:MAG: tetratricopeptide repeat protein [Candidatus Thermoplasmatota archaeon]|nr:tetratricopeptide repeat protein [Candidatus Thermoplasmatota archaeon]
MAGRTIDPLSIGIEIKRLLESEMGEMGVLTYKKQCWDLGLNPDRLEMKDVVLVARGVARAISPIIGQDRSKAIEKGMIRFKVLAELAEANKERDQVAKARKTTGISLSLGEISLTLKEYEDAKRYYKQAVRDAKTSSMPVMEAKAYRGLGHIHREMNDWEEALRWFEKALEHSTNIGDNIGKVDSLRGMGRVYWNLGNFDRAKEVYENAMDSAEKLNDKEVLGITYIDMGNVHNEKGDLDRAEKYYLKAIPLLEDKKNFEELARAYNNVGDIMLQRKEWKKSLDYFQRCKQEAEKILNDRMTAWSFFNMAEAHLNLEKLDLAIENINHSLPLLRVSNDARGITSALKLLGEVYVKKKDWEKADESFSESLEHAERTNSPHYLCRTYLSWSASKFSQGKKKEAKEYLRKAKEILGSIDAAELQSKIENMEEKLS